MAEVKINMNPTHVHSFLKHKKYTAGENLPTDPCAAGHADCIPRGTLEPVYVPESGAYDTVNTEVATRDHEIRMNNHVHSYEDSDSLVTTTPVWKGETCALGHSGCVLVWVAECASFGSRDSSLPTGYGNEVKIAMTHTHTHVRELNSTTENVLVSIGTCPEGHSYCRGALITSILDHYGSGNYTSASARA